MTDNAQNADTIADHAYDRAARLLDELHCFCDSGRMQMLGHFEYCPTQLADWIRRQKSTYRRDSTPPRPTQWRAWFAWYPVKITHQAEHNWAWGGGQTVWLRFVDRARFTMGFRWPSDGGTRKWVYRRISGVSGA